MENSRYLACLAADFQRLKDVATGRAEATVPSCPGWTMDDLVRHVGQVYLHKVGAMRDGVEPQEWPPKGTESEEPLRVLERGYAALLHEFDTRKPEDPAGSWYAPDHTVGFWIRRMAQETVIHRIDAELAAQQP